MDEPTTKYYCPGSCQGESETPCNCGDESCEYFDKPLLPAEGNEGTAEEEASHGCGCC